MAFHVPEEFRIMTGPYGSDSSLGNNGLFEWGTPRGRIRVIASDGMFWEHVSVSFESRTPSWEEMCKVKSIFWDDDDCVIQYHPPKSESINFAKHCLHLWRPTESPIPLPPSWMVGPKEVS